MPSWGWGFGSSISWVSQACQKAHHIHGMAVGRGDWYSLPQLQAGVGKEACLLMEPWGARAGGALWALERCLAFVL